MVAAIVRMAKERPFVFVSYVREDYPIVSKFVTALRSHGIGVWIDVDALKPGEMWKHSIEDALERAKALLIFVSRTSVAAAWVQRELEIMIERSEMLVIPVILEQVEELPSALMERQWLLLTDASHERIEESAATLARQLRAQPLSSSHLSKPRLDAITDWALHQARGFVSSPSELPSVTATDSRGVLPVVPDLEPPAAAPGRTTASPSNTFQSIFIVHGHDVALFDDLF